MRTQLWHKIRKIFCCCNGYLKLKINYVIMMSHENVHFMLCIFCFSFFIIVVILFVVFVASAFNIY